MKKKQRHILYHELTDCIQRHKGCFIWFWLYSSKNASDESAFPWEEKCPDLHPMTYALMQKWKMQSNKREASISLSITAKYAMRGSSLLSHWMSIWVGGKSHQAQRESWNIVMFSQADWSYSSCLDVGIIDAGSFPSHLMHNASNERRCLNLAKNSTDRVFYIETSAVKWIQLKVLIRLITRFLWITFN